MRNVFSTTARAAKLAAAACFFAGLAGTAGATELGYGQFVGTWNGNVASSAAAIDNLETLIRNAYDGSPNAVESPFSTIGLGGDPDDPFVNQLHLAGLVNGSAGSNGRLLVTADSGNDSGTWTYLDLLAGEGERPRTDEVVDIYLLLKYGEYFSVFYYDEVDPLDEARNSGLWSIADPTLYGADYCLESYIDANPGSRCVAAKYKTNPQPRWDPSGISHVAAYWPALTSTTTTDVPEPSSLLLIGAGLFGLVALRRRRAN